jgi:L-fuculose-phosphate aldolase
MTEAEQICHFGRIIYERGFAAANDGNISMRLPQGGFLCTATMQSKGWLQPDDLCVVDENGDQISGKRKRSSEIMLHLEVYRHRPDVNAVVHCHPPHATAFAIAREPIPQCILPEVEIFLGEVPTARYETPGSRAFSESIIPFVKESNVMVLANHGTLSFGRSMELAWWFTDILDAYCRALILAKQLGRIHRFDEGKCGELLEYKLKWGFSDLRNHGPRAGCRVCRHEAFRETWESSGLRQLAFPDSDSSGASASSQSLSLSPATLDLIADAIVERLKGRV